MAYIVINGEICKSCHLCTEACSKGLIVLSTKINHQGYQPVMFLDSKECTGCSLCAEMCPEVAIEVYK